MYSDPRSAPEMRLAHELSALIDFDLDAHKLLWRSTKDVDIIIEPMNIVIEYDGSYWHRNKQATDLENPANGKRGLESNPC